MTARLIDYQLKKRIVNAWINYRDVHREWKRPEPVSGLNGFLEFFQWAGVIFAILAAVGAIAGVNRNGFTYVGPLLFGAGVSHLLAKENKSKSSQLINQMRAIEAEMAHLSVRFEGLLHPEPRASIRSSAGAIEFDPLNDEQYG